MRRRAFTLREGQENNFNNLFQYKGISIPIANRGTYLKAYFETQFGEDAKAIKDGEWRFAINAKFDNFRNYFNRHNIEKKINATDLGFLLWYLLTIGKCNKPIIYDNNEVLQPFKIRNSIVQY